MSIQLLSLLLEALLCPDHAVQLSTLSCLEPVLMEPPPALIQQLEALVGRLLALTASAVMVGESSLCPFWCHASELQQKSMSSLLYVRKNM